MGKIRRMVGKVGRERKVGNETVDYNMLPQFRPDRIPSAISTIPAIFRAQLPRPPTSNNR